MRWRGYIKCMAEFVLPSGPSRILQAAWKPLADHLGTENLTLGGGTALAARWHHRESTDVDLFTAPGGFRQAGLLPATLEALIRSISGLTLEALAVDEVSCHATFREGQLGLLSRPPIIPEPHSGDFVAGTLIRMESNAATLARKIHERILTMGLLYPRDLYDIACAAKLDPEALHAAWAARPARNLVPTGFALRSLSPGWMQRQERPVLRPAFADIELHAVNIVLAAIDERIEAEQRREGAEH